MAMEGVEAAPVESQHWRSPVLHWLAGAVLGRAVATTVKATKEATARRENMLSEREEALECRRGA